jgi:hypothetical protein
MFLSVGKFRVRSPDEVTDMHSPTGSSVGTAITHALDAPHFRGEDFLDHRVAKPLSEKWPALEPDI